MIIAGTRIATRSGHQPLADHVWRGAGNVDVLTLQGDEADLEDLVAFARHAGHRYALRHYHLSPGEPTTQAEGLDIIARIGAEFGFDTNTAVVVEHRKERRVAYDLMTGTQGYGAHWHVIVPEVDPISLKVLDSRKTFARHERLAREAELRLLHKVTKGRFNCAVIAALEKRDQQKDADCLRAAGIDEGSPAFAAYTSGQRRALERRHADHRGEPLDLPALVRRLQAIWAAHAPTPPALAAALRREGLRLRHPADTILDSPDGRAIAAAPITYGKGWVVDGWDKRVQKAFVLGALHRLVREPRSRVEETLRSWKRQSSPGVELLAGTAAPSMQVPNQPECLPSDSSTIPLENPAHIKAAS